MLEEYPLITGDVNRDGYIDIIDATAIQRHLAGLELIPAKNLAAADTDGDGEITVADVTQIQYYAAGIITQFA